jgi:hypothetical protein
MVTRLGEEDAVIQYAINEAVFLGDEARPCAGAKMAQRLWFADANVRIAAYGCDEFENPQIGSAVGGHPIGEVFEKLAIKHQVSIGGRH